MQIKIFIADRNGNMEALQDLETRINEFLEDKEKYAVNNSTKSIKLLVQEMKPIVLPSGAFAIAILWTYEEQS